MRGWLIGASLLGALVVGCQEPSKRLNTPQHGSTGGAHELSDIYTSMGDNALLANMTVSDIHFLPHRAQLSPLGHERMARLVSLMEAYGGTIRFNNDSGDMELTNGRLRTLVDFLAEAGVASSTTSVREDLPGGRGMDAEEVILIKANEGTYKPPKSSAGAAGAAGSPPKNP